MSNCPYCGEEMKIGTIESETTLSWLPEGTRFFRLSKWSISKKAVLIEKAGIGVNPAVVYAAYCEHCGKIIIDVDKSS